MRQAGPRGITSDCGVTIKELVFVTANKAKLKEVRRLLGIKIGHASIELHEMQSLYAHEIVDDKARKAYAIIGEPVLVEDTALYIDSLNGFPGALVRWLELAGYERMCRLVDKTDRRAYAETVFGLYDGRKMRIFRGRAKGKLAAHPSGANGFGWDKIFMPEGHSRAFAEMSADEKDRISHRYKAVIKLKRYLLSKA